MIPDDIRNNSCDHCRHGDHATCDEWFRDVCKCPHPKERS